MPDRKLSYNDKIRIDALMQCMDVDADIFVSGMILTEAINFIVRGIVGSDAPVSPVRKLPPYHVADLYLIQRADESVTEKLAATHPDIYEKFINELARIGSAGIEAYSAFVASSYYIVEAIAKEIGEDPDPDKFEDVFLSESAFASDNLRNLVLIKKTGSLQDALDNRISKEEAIEATRYHFDRLFTVADETYALVSEYPSVPKQKLLRAGYHNIVARLSLLASRYHIADVMEWVMRNNEEQEFVMHGFSTNDLLRPSIKWEGEEIFTFDTIETSVTLDALDYDALLDRISKFVIKPAKNGKFDVDDAVVNVGSYMLRGSSVASAWPIRLAKTFATNDLASGGRAKEIVRQMYRPYKIADHFNKFVSDVFPQATDEKGARKEFFAHLFRETDCACMKVTVDELITASRALAGDKRYLTGVMAFVANIHKEGK